MSDEDTPLKDKEELTPSQKLVASSQKLVVDVDWIESIYERLGDMEVLLDDDPLAYGPARIQSKFERIRTFLSAIERVYIDAKAIESRVKRGHRRLFSVIDLATKMMLANDPHVMAGASQVERNARATVGLYKESEELHRLVDCLADLEIVLSVIRSKKGDLKDTSSRLRDQMKLCQAEKWLGDNWGSKRDDPPELVPGQNISARLLGSSPKELEALINGPDEDLAMEELPAPSPKPKPALRKEESTDVPDVPVLGDAVRGMLAGFFDDDVEESKVEEPNVEESKVEESKVEEPNVEEPNVEEPNVEEPNVEEPETIEFPDREPHIDDINVRPLEEALPGIKSEKELEREMGLLSDVIATMDFQKEKKVSAKDFATASQCDLDLLIENLSM